MKEKIYRFMQGRYGVDALNRFLMLLSLILMLFAMLGVPFVYVLGILTMGYAYFRMLSRNIYKRSAENSVYVKYEYKVKQKLLIFKRDMQQRKTHHIYRCSSCKQKIRIPRGRGKVEIRCPKCNHTFIKRS